MGAALSALSISVRVFSVRRARGDTDHPMYFMDTLSAGTRPYPRGARSRLR